MRNTIIILFSALFMGSGFGQNPFQPPYAFIPDGEPHVFKVGDEERLYMYGSRDETIMAVFLTVKPVGSGVEMKRLFQIDNYKGK